MSLPELTDYVTDFLNGKEPGSPFIGDKLRNVVGEAIKAASKRTSEVLHISDLDTQGTIDFGEYFANGYAVAVMADPGTGAALYVAGCSQADADGVVTVDLDQAPGSGKTAAIFVMVDAYDKSASATAAV